MNHLLIPTFVVALILFAVGMSTGRRPGELAFFSLCTLGLVIAIPAIAGVRLPSSGNTGHFIAVLDRIGEKFVIGDPLEGRIVQS